MRTLSFLLFVFLISCKQSNEPKRPPIQNRLVSPKLDLEEASRLIALPLHCIGKEYPNKLGQTIGSEQDLQSPKALHPAFYGCFDWHSSVHGHWSLVSLLKQFPALENADQVKQHLLTSISKENIKKEVAYFYGKYNESFERTYGWAWLLQLAQELHTWEDGTARVLEQQLQPLTDLIVQKYMEFLPKLNYPIRVGEHSNTAFGLTFAWDYAKTVGHQPLKDLIAKRAKEFFLKDTDCPITWEPSGYDFLSPCLQEAAIMKRVLPQQAFKRWFDRFLPQLKDPHYHLAVGEVSDRTDGKLVHLDGLNFSRAWCLFTIIRDLPEYDHLKRIAHQHVHYSLPNLVGDSYEGGHWLGSFAIYALDQCEE